MATYPCSSSSRRLFISDRRTKVQFLVDTGSDICVYPRRLTAKLNLQLNYTLSAANGTNIRTYGDIILQLDFGLRRNFTWRFIVADVTMPILGADFLAYYNIIIDIKNSRLHDNLTSLSSPGCVTFSRIQSVKPIFGDSAYNKLLADFLSITRPSGLCQESTHKTFHYIRTTPGPPVSSRPRRLKPELLRVAKEEFKNMIELGIARPSDSSWI
ncbi:uncharacterized protein LOC113389276 [Ctenocephalides felis]|uniref:uncharacterized protein LOC113389276 n=1 Tax=Ctenocephalides felis TaxID=7515 RepID=UPI000E6E1548|nr:uncharacterized protein LOC113389276 [Ctenocephalides felis]